MWLQLLLKVFGGAATGYITNNLALNMLFKKYGPFGGVILETKSEFIENAAELVERDIINHNTVSSKLYSQEFEAVSEKIIADILHKYIYEHTGDIICKDIPGFNSTSTNILNFLEQNFNKYLDHYLALAEEHSTTGDILSQKQITYISSKILPEFISVVKYNDSIDDSLLKIYKKYQHKKIKHLLVSDIFEQVSSNIGKIDPGSVLQVNKNQIEKFMKIIDFSSLLDKVIVQENNKKSSSMIELQITTNQDKVSLILQNTKIKKVIKALINGLLDLLEEVDSPLIDIFSPKFAIKVEKLINSQLPNILANIIFWIKDNKVELESLIEEATEEVLNESTGIKNNIKRIIFKSFRENIEKKHKIIDRIINQLEGQLDVEQFSQTLTKLILSYFKNTEISEIIKYLRENNLLKSEEILQFVLTHFIDSNYIISKNKVTIDLDILTNNKDEIRVMIIDFLNELSSNPEVLTDNILDDLSQKISELPNKKVGQAIDKKTFLKYVNLYKNKQLKKVSLNPEKVSRTIGHSMFKFIKDDRFSFLLNKQTSYQKQPTLSDNFHHITMSLIQNRIKKIRNKPLKEYYNNLQKKSSAPEKINKIVQEILEQNLAEILQGNIKNAVKDNLSGFSDQKVQAMVKEFMGEELKPITTLGAFLGGGAGLGLYFLNGLNPVTSILTYGFVGFITNVIALKMVFQPYEKKSLWGLNIPFTPGVVTRNKEQFAISLGDFIENRLLAPEAVQNTFQDNRKQLEKNITNIISKNNYQIFNQFIKNNSGFLAQKSSSSLLNYGLLNKNSLITTLSKNILNNKITYDMLEGYEKEVSQTILSNLEKNTHTLSRKINDIMKRDISIDELISDNFMEKKLEDIISNYINHLDNPKKIKKSLKIVADSTKNLRKQTFINLIPEEKVTDFNSFVINYIKNNNLANNFFDYVFSYLEDELNSDKKFKNIYQGKAFNLIRKNKSNIVNWLYEKILLYLEQERGKIKIEAQNALEVFIEKEKKQKSFLGKIKIMGLETTLKAININETINQLIDNLIDNKIPEYLENKKSDLENLIIIFLKNTEQKNVGNLGIQFNKKNIHEINNKLFDNQNTIEEISEDIFTAILQLNTNDLLNFLGLNDINSFYQFFQKEIMNISEHLRENETKISQNLSSLLTSLIQNNTGNITLKKLFANINQKDLKDSLDNLFNTLSKNNTLQQELEDIIDSVFQQISGKNLSEYISYKYLNQDLNKFANIFLYQEKPKNQLQNLMEKQLEEIFINLPPKIDQETKDFILDILLYSSLDSLDKHFIEIISAIDIKNITRTEIDNMAPQDIEELFDSFAAPYFTRLKLYGWLGSGIGGLVELFNYLTL